MDLGLGFLSLYFGFVGFLGLFRAGSIIFNTENILVGFFSVLIILIISGFYIYFAFNLRALLLRKKLLVQGVLFVVMLQNLLGLFLGANVLTAFANTDLLGKFLTFMIFGGSVAIYVALIYGIEILSKKLIRAEHSTPSASTTPNP